QAHDEPAPDHPPAPPQAAREGLEILEALLQPLSLVLPAAEPEGERQPVGCARVDGHVFRHRCFIMVRRASTSIIHAAWSDTSRAGRAIRPRARRSAGAGVVLVTCVTWRSNVARFGPSHSFIRTHVHSSGLGRARARVLPERRREVCCNQFSEAPCEIILPPS